MYIYVFFSLFVVELALSSSKAVGLHDISTRRCASSLHLWPLSSIRSDNWIWNYRKFYSALILTEKHQQSFEGKEWLQFFFSYSSWQLAWKKTQYVYTHRMLAGRTRLASYRLCFSSTRVTSCFFRYRHGFRPFGICMEAKSIGKISFLYNRAYNVTDLPWNLHLLLLVSRKIPPPPNDPWQIL